jgi:MFS family permease
MLIAIAIFLLGTGICGGAWSPTMLIAGRAVMGAGGGGMTMLIDIIVSDMVPLKKRPLFMGLVFFAINLGTALGPFVGGQVVTTTTWRWVFWLNIPITGLAAIILFVFLRTPWRRTETALQALARVDVIGNTVLIASTISILFGLTYAGTRHPWADWRIYLPLILGLAGVGMFFVLQSMPGICPHPVIPLRLFANRTSAVAYILTFVYMMLTIWRLYFLPVYFQSTMHSSPARAGIQVSIHKFL